MKLIVLILLFLPLVNSKESQQECEPVKVKVYVDITLDAYSRQQCLQIFKGYTDLLLEGSQVDLTTVNGQSLEQVGTFTLPNAKESLWAALSAKLGTPLSNVDVKIPSKSLEYDLLSYFVFGKYRTIAEFVLFFVSSSSDLDVKSNTLRKKKTLVVEIGNDANPNWKAVASKSDHYFHASSGTNMYVITEGLIDVTCNDSKLTCDTDEFSTSKGSVCQKCVEYYCKRMDSLTCHHRCPYYRKPSADQQIKPNSATSNPIFKKSADNKPETATVVFVILGVVSAPFVAMVVIFLYKNLNNGQTIIHEDLSQRNTTQDSRNLAESQVLIPDRVLQQGPSGATAGLQEQGPTDIEAVDRLDLSPRITNLENRNSEEHRDLIPNRVPQGPSGAEGGNAEPGPTDEEHLLKNGRELEINIMAFDEPPFHDIQEGKRAAVRGSASATD